MKTDDLRKIFCELYDEKSKSRPYDFQLLDFSKENYFEKNIPALYRYSSADYYNIRSLETKKIHLSEIGNMNDIFEGLSCKTTDKELSCINKLKDSAYIKSFSENANDLSMWSRYADNFAGMCVKYNVNKLDDNILCHLYPIRYSDSRLMNEKLYYIFDFLRELKQSQYDQSCIDNIDFLEDLMSLFLSKSKIWEYEAEWRLIFSYLQLNVGYEEIANGQNEDEKILYDFDSKNIDFDCAVEIYIGPKMEAMKREHIKEIGKKLNIKVTEMQLSNDSYQLIEST